MSSISVNNDTKREFDNLQPDDMTQDEFTQELLDAYRRDNGEVVNVQELVDDISKQIGASIELAAYRGTSEAIETKLEE
jgi:phosphatidylserine/phosphatidylglycerophosphate/cardiolipin synthase-like enzyme